LSVLAISRHNLPTETVVPGRLCKTVSPFALGTTLALRGA
jgi:hypothetical protein